ncbi:MAG: hypothetical protein KKF16_09355 [Euryarchaeota archaeon]|nr:hypothetical protein [Euryarchaeota archaeon]MBU4607706.1 hypothetical protein [Euryarchaeota archaeon]MBV1755936.1 hypothetical protein [Methanobacterium sp.]
MQCSLKVYTPVNPTEDPVKVEKAITNIFKPGKLEIGPSHITLHAGIDSLFKLKEDLEQRKIRSCARSVMEVKENKISFILSKQAALVDVVNLLESKSPLGELEIEITTSDVEGLLDWLAPDIEDE